MYIAFTICSNNYLAKAKVVADSFLLHHPNYSFFIFLVDTFNTQIDYSSFANSKVVEVKSIFLGIDDLAIKYNIIELNTAVKPFIIRHLFNQYSADLVIYLDPDLMIFSRFKEVEKLILEDAKNAVITPHFCSPIDDGIFPSEIDFAPYGLYNLGFIAVRNSSKSHAFLQWWHERLMKYGFARPKEGMFTDQLWINYAPLFFKDFFVLNHLGYNIANWNLYERVINKKEDTFFINEEYKLRFFHFSHYDFEHPYTISKRQFRHKIEERQDVKMVIDIYQTRLLANNQPFYAGISCYYYELYQQRQAAQRKQNRTMKARLKNRLRLIMKAFAN